MSPPVAYLIIATIAVCVLVVAAGPTLVGLVNALPSLVLAIGLVVALLRLVWCVTSRRPPQSR